jgi:hypothetical protein
MFGNRYFGARYFGDRYWGEGGSTPAPVAMGGSGKHRALKWKTVEFPRIADDDDDVMMAVIEKFLEVAG